MPENVDEIIDRVAGEMTVVNADSALTDRIRQRLADRRRPLFMPVLAAASVAGAIVIATALWPQREPAVPARTEFAATAIAPIASLRLPVRGNSTRWPDAPSRASSSRVESRTTLHGQDGTSVSTTETTRGVASVGVESAAPVALTVAEAIIAPVTTPDAVAIAPLDVTPLEVPELDTIYESKEPK